MLRSIFSKSQLHNRRIEVGAATDIGFVRLDNEDSYGVFRGGVKERDLLLIVADGMGGFDRGAEASALAVDTIRATYYEASGEPADRLRLAFQAANAAVLHRAQELGLRMGTTCTALSLEDTPVVSHIGDSRAYDVSPDDITLITVDHTLAGELRDKGVITAEQAATHPGGHALTRAIGVSESVEPSIRVLDLRAPRWLVLCTDGLRKVERDRLASLVRRLEPQQACEALVSEANQTGGTDNSTIIVARLR